MDKLAELRELFRPAIDAYLEAQDEVADWYLRDHVSDVLFRKSCIPMDAFHRMIEILADE